MIDAQLKEYLHDLIPKRTPFFDEMEKFAKEEMVPIMEPYSMETLLQFLRLFQPKSILEIGAAIGYSSLRMADAVPAKIVTVERDTKRIHDAKHFINQAGKTNQIQLLEGDAFELVDRISQNAPYDCLFIDAAKGQYLRFFETFEPFLSENGLIITDNVLFKGFVYQDESDNKRLLSLGKKINAYNEWLLSNPSYHTIILPVGDGIAVSYKK